MWFRWSGRNSKTKQLLLEILHAHKKGCYHNHCWSRNPLLRPMVPRHGIVLPLMGMCTSRRVIKSNIVLLCVEHFPLWNRSMYLISFTFEFVLSLFISASLSFPVSILFLFPFPGKPNFHKIVASIAEISTLLVRRTNYISFN